MPRESAGQDAQGTDAPCPPQAILPVIIGTWYQAWEEGNLRRAAGLITNFFTRPGQPDLRGFEWRYLWNICQDESLHTVKLEGDDPARSLATTLAHRSARNFSIFNLQRAAFLKLSHNPPPPMASRETIRLNSGSCPTSKIVPARCAITVSDKSATSTQARHVLKFAIMFAIPRRRGWFVGLAIILFGTAVALGQQRPREFPPGSVRRVEDLPPSRLRTEVERLPVQIRDRAVAWLGSFHFTELDLDSLQVDPAGGIFYADKFTLAPAPAAASTEPIVSAAAVPVSPFPASLRFHSRPGAANVLYINFSGESVSNTAWNTLLGRTVIPAVPFSTDGDFTTFSDAEQSAIKRIWQRMAEDYAPFNIDVTTERPATFTTRTTHAVITRNTDANGLDNPAATSGGVAYVNVFASPSFSTYRPAWIYFNNLAYDESYISEAASHEIGHNMGLSHDGRTDGYEYYGGHGSGDTSWGPLMGTGYNRNVSQWSKGEYYLASNTEDDLAIIAAKTSYRADDHGNTSANATALTVIGGTNVLATTPETDPANTNGANKGVLERNTDIDVFSFAAGTGPIDLAVSPWITPSGITRGGNLDVLIELYDANGVRLITNNSSSLTLARIQTNLTEGIYYLWVRNSGAGNPTNSSPDGYTPYGSIGQYFITGSMAASGSIIPPGATLQVTDITQPGIGAKQFTVTYSDNVAIDVGTIDGNDILVTGTNGYARVASLVSVNISSNGTPRVATYSVVPPLGSTWTAGDGGIYSVWMQTNQVRDTEGAAVAAGKLGQFNVSVPHAIYFASMDTNPGWTLESQWQYGKPMYPGGTGPTNGFTGTNIIGFNLSGNYPNRLATAYATTPPINCTGTTSLTLRFRRWLGLRGPDTAVIQVSTNGAGWTDIWSTSSSISDNSWQEVQYALPGWAAGQPSVRVRWGLGSNPAQNDIGWNIDDVQILSGGSLDTTPPIASLSIANLTSAGAPTHSFTVTFTDDSAVRIATLSSSNLVVTGPSGYSNQVDFVGVDTLTDGTPRTASYSIPAPNGTWSAADNGAYTITILNGQVTDTFNNSIAESVLGSFTVAISTNHQALVVEPTFLSVPEGSNAFFTIRLAEPPAANVTVTVAHSSGDTDLIVQSGATNTFTPSNWSVPIPVTLAALTDPDQLNGTATFECRSAGLATVIVQATEIDATSGNVLSVTVNNPAWGTTTPGSGSYPVGTAVQVTATPSNYFHFAQWTGDYSGTNNPLTVVLDTQVSLQAIFGEMVTTNHLTPYWWLAANGQTQNFDTAENLIGSNGLALWQSYVAGLNPNDPESQFRLRFDTGIEQTNLILRWNPVAGRVYTVLQSANPALGFAPLPNASNLPDTIQSFTNSNPGAFDTFYRIEVTKPASSNGLIPK